MDGERKPLFRPAGVPPADREFTLKTGSHRSAATHHYRLKDGRALEVILQNPRRGSKSNQWSTRLTHGLIATVRAEHGGDYTTKKHTRSFDLEKRDDGWHVREKGWTEHVGGGDPNSLRSDGSEYLDLEAGPFETKKAAEEHAIQRLLTNTRIDAPRGAASPGGERAKAMDPRAKAAYEAGWKAGRAATPGKVEAADRRGAHPHWYLGFFDAEAGNEKYAGVARAGAATPERAQQSLT